MKWRPVVTILIVPLLIAGGVLLFTLTQRLVSDGEPEAGTGTTVRPSTKDLATTTSSPTMATLLKSMECGSPATTDTDGNLLDIAEMAKKIHDTACNGDYSDLLPLMDDMFGGSPKGEVVDKWAAQYPNGDILRILTQTLELPALVDQGGIYFCNPSGAVAIFSRGTNDRPGSWSDFDTSGQWLALCGVDK